MTTRFGNDTLKFIDLALGTDISTKSSLGKLLSTLILGVLEQFHNTTFIRSETSNFTDDATNESSALAKGL